MKPKSHIMTTLFIVLSAFSLLLMLIATLQTYQSAQVSTDLIIDEVRKRLESTAVAAANFVSYERLEEITTPEDVFSPEGEQLRSQLIDFANQMDLMFVYYLRLMPDLSEEFVIDSDTDPQTLARPGMPRVSVDASRKAAAGEVASMDLSEVESLNYDDHSAYFTVTEEIDEVSFISAFAPIYDPEGNVAYIAGVDGLRYNLHTQEKQMKILTGLHLAALLACVLFTAICVQMFRSRAKQSEEASRAKSQFLSSMSHEIRTPLNMIIGMTDIAMHRANADKAEYLGKIQYASKHLLTIVNDILDISKIQEHKFTISPTNFTFRQFMNSLTDHFQSDMAQKEITFQTQLDPEIPEVLFADDQRLSQVLMNLLSNALKFTEKGGTVLLEAKLMAREADHLRLYFMVKDNGVGIPKEDQTRIFNPFEQADKSTTRRFGGTGLGLAISKAIVEAMDGMIGVESEPGGGSTFYFEINVTTGTQDIQSAQIEDTIEAEIDFSNKTILVVDDMEINRDIVTSMLEDIGVSILHAADGEEAVDAFRSNESIDLILMDVQMPKMDGLTATRIIRAFGTPRAGSLQIIAMTANALKEDVDNCLDAGMNSHLGKPIDRNVLIQEIMKSFQIQEKVAG
ncbi:MAG: response regulator [Lachnospiraceae bacterium]|nr:response regulator [Lachnospiraceae bacterium]